MNAVPQPPWWGVALSLLLIGAAGYVAHRKRLGLGRDVAEATVRAAAQLVLVGLLLGVVLAAGVPAALAWVSGMVALAGVTAGRRARGLPGAVGAATAGIATAAVATLGLLFGAGVIETQARIVLPLGGMVVSAAMLGASITLTRVRDEAAGARSLVEARLALGLPGPAAFAPQLRLALRSALQPALDQTKVVGLITLPGTMTGLIIAGVSPMTAIRYQIVVQFMFVGAGAISALVAARVAVRSLFDDAHRLRTLAA